MQMGTVAVSKMTGKKEKKDHSAAYQIRTLRCCFFVLPDSFDLLTYRSDQLLFILIIIVFFIEITLDQSSKLGIYSIL